MQKITVDGRFIGIIWDLGNRNVKWENIEMEWRVDVYRSLIGMITNVMVPDSVYKYSIGYMK